MRYCDKPSCANPANWREKAVRGGPGYQYQNAYCEKDRQALGLKDDECILIRHFSIKTVLEDRSQILKTAPSLNPWGG